MARLLKNSKINPQGVDADDAYNRKITRADQLDKALEDPQPGPVEQRGAAVKKASGK